MSRPRLAIEQSKRNVAAACLAVFSLLAGCSPSSARPSGPLGPSEGAPASTKRLVAGMKTVPPFLYQQLNPANVSGGPELCDLVGSGLTFADDRGALTPMLAEVVPTTENGLWVVLPDGRMETTWRLRKNTQWHDGTSFTAEDLAFTFSVVRDRELAVLRDRIFDTIEGVEVVDPQTAIVRWRQPFIGADTLFSGDLALPLPRHLLERAYREDKSGFLDLPYWSTDFVGTGPFRLREWDRGSHLVLRANEAYALGSPKLAELEVRFIIDDNTLLANILAGSVDFTLGRGIAIDQALEVQEQWREGRAEFKSMDNWVMFYPQFINPTPPIVANSRFRRALVHAIDRQELVDTIEAGRVVVAHSPISPNFPQYREIEASIVKVDYDPRQGVQVLEALGYTRDGSGAFRDRDGQRLSVGIQVTTVVPVQIKSALPIADGWQRVGVGVDVDVVPPQRGQDLQYRAEFPSFALQRQPVNTRMLIRIDGSQARTAERGYTGINNARYVNPEVDALLARYLTTIPLRERTRAMADLVHRITDEQIWMGLFFDTEPSLIGNRTVNIFAKPDESRHTWNAHLWDAKG